MNSSAASKPFLGRTCRICFNYTDFFFIKCIFKYNQENTELSILYASVLILDGKLLCGYKVLIKKILFNSVCPGLGKVEKKICKAHNFSIRNK